MNRLLVTGTDTGVGKTVVASGLARLLHEAGYRMGVLKPVETGWEGPPGSWSPDARMLAEGARVDDLPEQVAPCVYAEPLAPLVAARRAGRPVDLGRIEAAWQRLQDRDWVLVETAGGLAVPLTDTLDYAGLAVRWQLPVLVVSRPGLGTLNHTFLTVYYARSRGLPVVGVVLCGYPEQPNIAEQTNPAMIEAMCHVPVLGRVPRRPAITSAGEAAEAVAEGLQLESLLKRYEELLHRVTHD
jgi:dethiobiotin synthetase